MPSTRSAALALLLLVPVPTLGLLVVLFGPETPELFGGLSPHSHTVWAETACSPCVTAYNNRVSTCRDNVCMQMITVEQVHGVVRGILTGQAAAPTIPAVPPRRPDQPATPSRAPSPRGGASTEPTG